MKNKLIGVLFHTAGVVMLTLAYKGYYTSASKVSRFFKGAPPEKVTYYLIGGTACTLVGLYHLFRPGKK